MRLLLILSILQSLFTAVETKPLEADINLTVTEQRAQPFSYNGHGVVYGKRFLAALMGYELAYDGRTMYVWAEDTDELTLTTPSEQELLEVNPFLFAREVYKVSRETKKVAADGRTAVITLTPAEQTATQRQTTRVVVRVSREGNDWLPTDIELHEGTKVTKLSFSHVRWADTDIVFVLDHPSAFLNDLR